MPRRALCLLTGHLSSPSAHRSSTSLGRCQPWQVARTARGMDSFFRPTGIPTRKTILDDPRTEPRNLPHHLLFEAEGFLVSPMKGWARLARMDRGLLLWVARALPILYSSVVSRVLVSQVSPPVRSLAGAAKRARKGTNAVGGTETMMFAGVSITVDAHLSRSPTHVAILSCLHSGALASSSVKWARTDLSQQPPSQPRSARRRSRRLRTIPPRPRLSAPLRPIRVEVAGGRRHSTINVSSSIRTSATRPANRGRCPSNGTNFARDFEIGGSVSA